LFRDDEGNGVERRYSVDSNALPALCDLTERLTNIQFNV
jgi:hypothetical protein